ncbi:nucleotidyltransferase domain-containing protein [Methylobacterium organophilum]|uniref:nucleotidyltransferase family protein n=1 Tax=Methylobacterium organophilum TaxID=410 RepID=UPI001F14675C|nr:nucleotidyltransferase domain-containing protein [Methylobacterium organophilum]UMY15983.1 nucleotidyltransferase domain-containing protein [Methylobacterium organophilum]
MRRQEAISRLKAVEPDMRALGIGRLFLFGSVARDEATPTSDIDIFVEPAASEFYTLANYVGAYERLRMAFPDREIGYSTWDGLSKHIRPEVEREAVRIF